MYNFKVRYCFILGLILGISIKLVLHQRKSDIIIKQNPYEQWFWNTTYRLNKTIDEIRYGRLNHSRLESEFLFNSITILCVILVSKVSNYEAAKATWAKGCNKIAIVSLEKKPFVSAYKGRESSKWVRLCQELPQLDNAFQWTLFVYDSSFVVMENLRYMLAGKDYREMHYLGHPVTYWNVQYNMGKAGYVLSQGSLQKVQDKVKDINCSKETSFLNQEDLYLGKYMASLNIKPEDTRDSKGLSTFYAYNWYQELLPGMNYYKTSVHSHKCCSEKAISFQSIEADKMYTYYYLLYKLQLFKSGSLGSKPPTPIDKNSVWKSFLKERGIENDQISSDEYYRAWEDLIHDPDSFGQQFKPDH